MKIKSTLFLVLFVLCTIQAFAQSPYEGTVTLFAEEGENFTLFIDGEKINASPAAKVVADKIQMVSISMRVVFEDGSIPAVKKNAMRGAKDCTYVLRKDKKGEYVVKVKTCMNPFPQAAGPAPVESIAPTASSSAPQKLSATYSDGTITVNNGNTYTVTKSGTSGGFPSPHVIMKAPNGAKVTITYDDNSEKYVTEVPFDYEVKDYMNNNSYFRLTVDEGGPDKTWYVRLQNGTGYVLTIE